MALQHLAEGHHSGSRELNLQPLVRLHSNQVFYHHLVFNSNFSLFQFSQGWYRLDSDRYYRGHYYCSWRYFEINLEDDRLFLTTFGIQTYMEGLYRCVSDEAAFGSDNSSTPLSITVHCKCTSESISFSESLF